MEFPDDKFIDLELVDSDDEDYQLPFDENSDDDDLENDSHVPLLEVNSTTGSLKSVLLEDTMNESFRQFFPDKKWVFEFPLALEKAFRPFDDTFIRLIQFTSSKVVRTIADIITLSVAVEILFGIPVFLFFIGVDGLASEFTYLSLITALITQIPKRFIWRYRPWMVQRANKLRGSSTSSFPSRAVCCSVIFAFGICYSYCYFNGLDIIWWWMPELFILLFLASSFARTFLGVHYPSDCVIGAIQGLIICALGTLLWGANLWGCTSCRNDTCYAVSGSPQEITASNLADMSIIPFLIVILLSLLLTIIMMIRPINFWRKCDRAMGLLLPCVAFQVGFLCPNGSLENASLAAPHDPPLWWTYPVGILVPVLTILLGSSKLKSIPFLSFITLYTLVSVLLITWRLFILPLD